MGDAPVVAVNTTQQVPNLLAESIPQEVHNALLTQYQTLAHKHVTISYTLIGILALVLVGGGFGAFFAAKWVDRALARAEKSEQLYLADKKVSDQAIADLKTQLADSEKARAAAEQKAADLQKQANTIAAVSNQQQQQVLKPGKTASEAYADAKAAYGAAISTPINIVESPDKTEQMLAFRIPDIQQMTATKIDDTAQKQIVVVKDGIIATKQGEIDGLKKDLATSQDALGKLQTTEKQEHDALEKYKSVAKKSKFKRILGGFWKGTQTVAIAVAAFELGHKL